MKKPRDLSRVAFFLSAGILVFGYGVAVGALKVFPYPYLDYGARAVKLVWENPSLLRFGRPTQHLRPARHEGDGVTRNRPGEVQPGLTLISGLFTDTNGLRLLREDGTVVRSWPVSFNQTFPAQSHIEPPVQIPDTDWNIDIHGAHAFPDGSVVMNFEYGGLVKLDRCGDVVWTVPRMTHHSIDVSEQGTLWVPGRRWVEAESRHPPLATPYYEDTLLEISGNGEVLREISVVGLFFENDLQSLLLANGLFDVSSVFGWNREIVHLNDIEVLTSEMAPRFPQFAAGDLLISLRNHNLIMIVDPDTETIKWHQTGPWIRQHDPDFTDSGRIVVFNNNNDAAEGTLFGGSDILAVDPATREVTVEYEAAPGRLWFTHVRGKQQILANGNALVTENEAGRVFEVTTAGDVVWEFVNRYDEDEVARISDAVRYPRDYFTVSWECPG